MTSRMLQAAVLSLGVVGCAKEPGPTVLDPDQLVFVTRAGCVNTDVMRERLDQALGALGIPASYQFIDAATLPNNDIRLGHPTPTVLYRDADVFGMPTPTPPFPDPT